MLLINYSELQRAAAPRGLKISSVFHIPLTGGRHPAASRHAWLLLKRAQKTVFHRNVKGAKTKESKEEPGPKQHFIDKLHFKSLQTEINFHCDEQLPRTLYPARPQNKNDYIDHPFSSLLQSHFRFLSGGDL